VNENELEIKRQELIKQRDEAAAAGDTFKVKMLDSQLAELEEQAQAVQEEQWTPPNPDVLDYDLPFDYDEIYGNGCHEEIQKLMREALNAAALNYAANIEDLRLFYASKLDVLKTANSELANRFSDQKILLADMERDLDEARGLVDKLTREKSEIEREKNDALAKRDAAADALDLANAERDKALRDVESLRGQVDELDRIIAAQKRPQSTWNVGGTAISVGSAETPEERKARLLRLKQDTINRNLEERWNLPPLRLPTDPADEQPVTDKQLEEAFPSAPADEAVVCDDAGANRAEEAAEDQDEARNEEARITLEERLANLEHRVDYLEHQLKGQVA
jgi:hypothetical protein